MFHDTPINRFTICKNELRIETDEFAFSFTETVPPGRITITGVRAITRNGVTVATFEVESDDAEINGLDVVPDGVRLILFWHFWNPEMRTLCCGYWFPGANLTTEAPSGGPLMPTKRET